VPPVRVQVPLPFALRTANVYLFPGGSPAMVDCGIGTPECREAVLQAVQRAGLASPTIHLTHGHVDHAGNAAFLGRAVGARLAAPPEEAGFVEDFHTQAPRRNEAFAEAMRAHGVPASLATAAKVRGETIDHWHEDCPIHVPLRHGQRVPLGRMEAEVVLTPGHTPGSACYLTPEHELLTGDTLLPRITSNAIELLDADKGRFALYLRTLEGLRRFVGVHALPGHGEPFALTDEVLDTHLGKHDERTARVLAALDQPRTAYELLPRVFPRLAEDQLFLGMCEVVGHLHRLELEGKASWRRSPRGRLFSAA
jgi:glyoxylase-like metal-dependent hydrolase (beta-lactamase superfamily II)